eukprot:2413207-Heterocapsa_arctica.AAC.1
MSVSIAGPRTNGMALSGSNDEDDDDCPIAGGQETSTVNGFPPGALRTAEEEDEGPESDFRGSCTRFVGDVRGSGGADNCCPFLAADSV